MTMAMIRMAATKKEIFVVSSGMMSPYEVNAIICCNIDTKSGG